MTELEKELKSVEEMYANGAISDKETYEYMKSEIMRHMQLEAETLAKNAAQQKPPTPVVPPPPPVQQTVAPPPPPIDDEEAPQKRKKKPASEQDESVPVSSASQETDAAVFKVTAVSISMMNDQLKLDGRITSGEIEWGKYVMIVGDNFKSKSTTVLNTDSGNIQINYVKTGYRISIYLPVAENKWNIKQGDRIRLMLP